MIRYNQHYFLIALSAFCLLVAFIYIPGMQSIFLLDDHVNLDKLSSINSFNDWNNILGFILNGVSSDLGRPLSLLSFAIQFEAWPYCPFCFKLANLAIHIANAFLIFFITKRIFDNDKYSKFQINALALFVASAWVAHPIQVSTVLYTIQRMAELSTFFTLVGLIFHIKGREILSNKANSSLPYILMALGAFSALILGILSKENAILFCLYVIAFEFTIFGNSIRPTPYRIWMAFVYVAPLLLLIVFLFPKFSPYIFSEYPSRTYSATERLLTEFRILFDYVFKIIIPRPNSFGLFHTNFELSTSLTNPISTIISLAGHTILITSAFLFRKSFPALSLGILLFYSSHVLESSVLNLELYFEHRNYFASFGVLLCIAALTNYGINSLKGDPKKRITKLASFFGGIWVLLLLAISAGENRLWSMPHIQAKIWSDNNPLSYRAQGHYSHILTQMGFYNEAYENYEKNINILSRDAAIPLLWLQLQCYDKNIPSPDIYALNERIRNSEFQNAVLNTFNELAMQINNGECESVNASHVLKMVTLFIDAPAYQSNTSLRSLYIIKSKFERITLNYDAAASSLQKADEIEPSPDIFISLLHIHTLQNDHVTKNAVKIELDNYCKNHRLKCLPFKGEISSMNNHN